ncbi:Eco57I restriction-modification methylase domain-containing protein [Salinibacter ruber]|uniref:Eco57I restriction-modification methylase domain-containing protein n=1 Tax=Salinibacter ruber TaxID=146919 RepID=UPI0020748362|nr:DNA methyltransferase [Salinibacter ruber]
MSDSKQGATIEDEVRSVIKAFINKLREETSEQFTLGVILNRNTLTSRDIGQEPEAFTEQHLIDKLLDTLGFSYKDQATAFGGAGKNNPDFELEDIGKIGVIGENKSINKWDEAPPDIDEYLDSRSVGAEYGIGTDGMVWSLHRYDQGSDREKAYRVKKFDLKPVFIDVLRGMGSIPSDYEPEFDDPEGILSSFVEWFRVDNFEGLISSEIPQWVREERKKGVDEFFDLFIELIFGEERDKDYSTSLVDEIIPPRKGASEREKNMFSVVLANRLIFVKLLEEYGIVDPGFLTQRLIDYEDKQDDIAGNFYDTQLKPLFYSLLNTPPSERSGKHTSGWFSEVPYLNGGLFRETVENEYQYSVSDYIIKKVVRDLIEGHRLQSRDGDTQLDPSILGKVFEKTITYLEHGRDQKDVGAYYTPTDVTRLIISDTLDRKTKDILVETFASHASADTDAVAESMRDRSLEDILRDVEQGSGWFGNTAALEEAEEKILNIKTADPACGSGHFLTSLMTAIYRVWEVLYKGSHGGSKPDEKEVYETRKKIALQSIYGVDIEPIAVEIAKLRLWLKVIEGIEWERSYGPLPNIDMNIITGNSLVGLPLRRENGLPFWSDDVEKLASLRREHKYDDEGRKQDIIEVREQSVDPNSNSAFINQFNQKYKWKVDSHKELKEFLESCDISDIDSIFTNEFIRVKSENGKINQNQESYLESFDFTVHKKVAKRKYSDLVDTFEVKNDVDRDRAKEEVYEWICGLENEDLTLESIIRRPTMYDLSKIVGSPLHWSVIFPELNNGSGDGKSIHFDIVVGNPPYGDILNKSSRFFLQGHITGDYRDVSAPFVERQLQLLAEGGYFGNITTAQLVYKGNMREFHEMLRHQLEDVNIACFGSRPSKIFSNAEVRTTIMTGKRTQADEASSLKTSEFILFTPEDRGERLRSIPYKEVDGLFMGDAIGKDNGSGKRWLPKIGREEIHSILKKLSTFRRKVSDVECSGDCDHSLYFSRGSRYWLSPMLDRHYSSGSIKTIDFDDELHQRLAFLIVHSSVFYLYWMTYGDQFHLNKGQIRKFPLPPQEIVEINKNNIYKHSSNMWSGMKGNFNSNTNEFHISSLVGIVDDIDDLISDLYQMHKKSNSFLKRYNREYRISN